MSDKEILKVINEMANKHCDLDPVPFTIFKKLAPQLKSEITTLVNLSLSHGVFAESWKTSIVKPLLKKVGLELIFKNYRPVSNLKFLAKLVEKCMLLQFNEHCSMNSLLPSYQSAYRKFCSCKTVLLKLANNLLNEMENQRVSALVVMVLSAAFDTVHHKILFDVLSSQYGIEGKALRWFDTCLRPHFCQVDINGARSSIHSLDFSVPQGSCTGPMLYTVYASMLQYQISEGMDLNGFADDHSVNKSFNPNDRNDELRTIELLESSLGNINSWMNLNRLQMNTSKTEFMMIGSGKQLSKCVTNNITVCNDTVEKNAIIRLLGIWIDSNLNFKTYVIKKSQNAMLNIFKIKHIRRYLTQEACEVLVHGLVMSHLDYCNSLHNGLPDCDLNRLQRVQSIACKLVLNRSKYDSCTECFTQLHWLPIRSRVQHKILTMVHTCLNQRAPECLSNILTYRSEIRPSRSLRSELNYRLLQVPRTKLKTFEARSFRVAGPTLWNNIPDELRCIDDPNVFKKLIKTFLFKKAFNL